ncbi:flavin reductase [Micromonospora sp. ALFpr18c]|uniref:flavin reductase n=1 Tax=unclassified Micromonospora TaxID=2617518 RepID=UPI00124B1920|nr:flavin reductase [Micromonospora sp. ALFpr18c]KAB1941485.1 flavin reductase [Micromonospora sp. ALFpr18c]
MTRRRPAHLPTRPTWRCRACGIAWPCSVAKLNLLAEYREDRAALLDYLTTLRDEAVAQLSAELPDGVPRADLTERFTGWASAR